MLLQDLLRDGQTKARAARLARARLVDAVEPVEQAGQILLRDADAVVRDADIDIFSALSDMNFDFTAVRRIFYRVGHDVRDHLLDALAVAVDVRDVVLLGEGHGMVVVLLGVELRRLVDVLHRLAEREARDVHFHLAVVDFAERQQILHDAGHTVGLADDDGEEVAPQLARQIVAGADDRLGVGLDVRQRCAQLVRDVRDKLTLRLLGFALLGDIVDDDKDAALRLVGRERGHEQLQLAVARGLL